MSVINWKDVFIGAVLGYVTAKFITRDKFKQVFVTTKSK